MKQSKVGLHGLVAATAFSKTNMDVHTATSPFLHPGETSSDGAIAVLGLRRDHLIPILLHSKSTEDSGYAEGSVINTRFGSFPHSTLINIPWGSQILASEVDTGSRGRRSQARTGTKRKHDDVEDSQSLSTDETGPQHTSDKRQRTAVAATSGFCHLLVPTPEAWTISLPHRTQVVYTPDYSLVLQRMRVRPGSAVIEAGAGSGSFTHAAARAVFAGYPVPIAAQPAEPLFSYPATEKTESQPGRVFSYEYHESRAAQLRTELDSHGLSSLVHVTHRDVYTGGFMLDPVPFTPPPQPSTIADIPPPTAPLISPLATAIFLDLPAPWLALPHLSRASPSALDPQQPAHLTAFLPCIEQAQRCVAALRSHGWVEISMCELAQRRLDVRRERTGLELEGLRGVNASPRDVGEAVAHLRQVEEKGKAHREGLLAAAAAKRSGEPHAEKGCGGHGGERATNGTAGRVKEGKQERLSRLKREAEGRKTFLDGTLVHRVEPEIKTHTSYLIFAVLPREWTAEDEAKAAAEWNARKEGHVKPDVVGDEDDQLEVAMS